MARILVRSLCGYHDKWLLFVLASTTWFLLCLDNNNMSVVLSDINNMAFVLFRHQQYGFYFFPASHGSCFFQCQQHGCWNWEQLVKEWEVVRFTSLRTKTDLVKGWCNDWQEKAMIGLGFVENHEKLSIGWGRGGHPYSQPDCENASFMTFHWSPLKTTQRISIGPDSDHWLCLSLTP